MLMKDIDYYLRATTHVGILTEKRNGRKLCSGSATGFWYVGGDPPRLHLVTNRHVCLNEDTQHYPDYLTAYLRHRDSEKVEALELPLYGAGGSNRLWHEFANTSGRVPGIRDPDIAVLPLTERPPFREEDAVAFDETALLPGNIVVDAGDDVRILGCPEGLYDHVNNLPIVRNAMTASAFDLDYLGMRCFVVDARLHGGLSGSPVLTVPHATVKEKTGDGNIRLGMGPSHAYLLGVLSADQQRGLGLGIVWRSSLLEQLVR